MTARSTIGGTLDTAALSRLHFCTLDRQEQAQAVRRLAATGMSEHGVAHATGWSVEAVRHVIADKEAARG